MRISLLPSMKIDAQKNVLSGLRVPRVAVAMLTGLFLAALQTAAVAQPSPFKLEGSSRKPVVANFDPLLGPPFALRERISYGREDAPVVIIEFSSLTCTHCRKFHEREFPKLLERFIDKGEVRWVVIHATADSKEKDNPLYATARGAVSANRYTDLAEVFFDEGDKAFPILRRRLMEKGDIERDEINSWAESEINKNAVAADFAEFQQMNLRGTPTFVLRKKRLNGDFVNAVVTGYKTADYFETVIDQLKRQ